jgi:hypothetical protein
VVVEVCYSTTSQGLLLFAFLIQFGFWSLLGCGVGGFGATTMLILLVVGVEDIGVNWLWGQQVLWGNPFPETQKPE